jgi:3-phosphoshikimate 1-carboxyvinyltransferase
MDIKITPSKLKGKVKAIPSKSDAHRTLICAALSNYTDMGKIPLSSEDVKATAGALKILKGAKVADCKESGSTLRFLLPVAAALGLNVEFTGSGRLPERPMQPMLDLLRDHGCSILGDSLPITISGTLRSGVYKIRGDISSQYISGLLLALPLLEGESKITLTSPLESRPYVDLTRNKLRKFGISVIALSDGWLIPGGQKYTPPKSLSIEGDWSNAAFWIAANALGSNIKVTGLDENSCQGDLRIRDLSLKPKASIDVKDIPDLVPILAILACGAKGNTLLRNCGRLRFKESDRIKSVCGMVNALGGVAEEKSDSILIRGTGSLTGGTLRSENDHRIVMAAAIAATICESDVIIQDAEAVNKSYPHFFKDYNSLGGSAHVV